MHFIERNITAVLRAEQLCTVQMPEELICQILQSKSLAPVKEIELYKLAVEWARKVAQGPTGAGRDVKDIAARSLKYIRFPMMSISQIMGTVQKDGLVASDVLLEAVAFRAERQSVQASGDRFLPRGTIAHAWDARFKHPELMLEDSGTTVVVPESVPGNGYRNVMSSQIMKNGTWKMRVDGLSGAQWVCLGVASTTEISNTTYNHRHLCTLSSSSNTFANRVAGKPISLCNGDIVTMSLDLKKKILSIKKNSSRDWQLKLRAPFTSCRIFACLYRPGNRVTLLNH